MRGLPYPIICLLAAVTALAGAGCNATGDCDPNLICNTVQPTTAPVSIAVTIDAANPAVPLAIYLGNANDSSLYFRDTVRESIRYDLPISQRYSVIAKYRQGRNTVYAVDGGKTRLVRTTNCDQFCYDSNELSLNLKLID